MAEDQGGRVAWVDPRKEEEIAALGFTNAQCEPQAAGHSLGLPEGDSQAHPPCRAAPLSVA